jgi:hypothetical protein
MHVWPRGPIAIGASIDLKCGDTTYTVSTGNDQGNCATGANGQVATCTDGKGNNAEGELSRWLHEGRWLGVLQR